MRVFMLALGTRGDVELFLMLARELGRRGHRVVLGTSRFYSAKVAKAGVEWLQIGNGSQAELVSILRALGPIGDRKERVYAYGRQWINPQITMAMHRIKAAAAVVDYFINNIKMVLRRPERIIPGASVTYDPPGRVVDLARYATQRPECRRVILEIVAMSRALVDPEHFWGDQFRFTGFWRDPAEGALEPTPEVRRFVEAGPPPVVITMGSMVTFDVERFLGVMTQALERAGQRGIVVGGWSGLPRVPAPPERVCCASEVPYGWLFPLASCVVHHGGCGTIAAVLRAAKPSILLPQITSQEHFGRMLTREKLATGVFSVESLNADDMAAAIRRAITDEDCLASARRWRGIVSEEPGVAGAADLIEAHWEDLSREPVSTG